MGLISRVSSRTYREITKKLKKKNKQTMSGIKEFFSPTDPKKLARDQKRELNRQDRALERDRLQFDREEAKLKQQIKQAAKKGDTATANILAKQIVKTRQAKQRSYQASAQIKGVGMNMNNMMAQQKMAQSMASTSKIMGKMNKQMDPLQVQKTMAKFSAENAKFEMTGELLDDAMDMAFDVDEGETDAVVTRVLDEIGVEIQGQMVGLKEPSSKVPGSKNLNANQSTASDADIKARMAELGIQL